MIRKDQLPDVWSDSWRCEVPAQTLAVGRDEELHLVLCDPQDAPMFMLRNDDVHRVMADVEHLALTLGEGARAKVYRLQGIHTPERQLTELSVMMQRDAHLEMCVVTLGGGHVRNNVVVRMQGEGCSCDVNGIYLTDREQRCDNYVFVEHAKPRCTSRELYKGIVDDSAQARFNGHVLVQGGAVKTWAYMTNRKILLTDKAQVYTRPFL